MEELQRIAMAYYNHVPDDVRRVAQNFLGEMDHNSDGEISLEEYLGFTREKGYNRFSNPHFFKELNTSSTGKLSFNEAITFFYMVNSARPLCDGCGSLVVHTYFTCVKCFDDDERKETFNVCNSCFEQRKYVHMHDHFLDNFVMLEAKRREFLAGRERPTPPPPSHESREATSMAIVPANPGNEILRLLSDAAVSVAVGVASRFCRIM